LAIILIVYIIEVITGMLLIIRWFRYKKDPKTAIGAADMQAVLYFLFNIGYAVYKVYIKHEISGFNFLIWLVIVLVLSIIVRKLYFKYQGVDPTKPDYEGKL